MPGAVGERFDFFLSRRGSVAAVAQEVSDVLTDKRLQGHRPGLRHPARRELRRGDARGGQERARPHHPVHRGLRSGRLTPARSSRASRPSGCATSGTVTSSSCAARMRRSGAFWPTSSIRTSSASPSPRSANAVSLRRRSAVRRRSGRNAEGAGRSSASRRALRVSPAVRTNSTGSTRFSPRTGPPP